MSIVCDVSAVQSDKSNSRSFGQRPTIFFNTAKMTFFCYILNVNRTMYKLTVIGHGFTASGNIQAHHIFIDAIRQLPQCINLQRGPRNVQSVQTKTRLIELYCG